MNKRRSLTPHTGTTAPTGAHPARRGGARTTVSDRVTFKRDGKVAHEGWALNVSRGGVRAILDVEDGAKIELGEEYDVVVGPASDAEGAAATPRHGRIVWLQEEPDGFVVGVEYIGDGAPGESSASGE